MLKTASYQLKAIARSRQLLKRAGVSMSQCHSHCVNLVSLASHRNSDERRDHNNKGNKWNDFNFYSLTGAALLVGASSFYYMNSVRCAEEQDEFSAADLQDRINKARDFLIRVKDEHGCPGAVVCVSVDGRTVWSQGLGYANVEQRVPCTPDTVMRIASISKPISMAILARLVEKGRIDLDKPVSHYVKYWPEKTFEGEKVYIPFK